MSIAEDTSTLDQIECLYNEFIMANTLIRAPVVKTTIEKDEAELDVKIKPEPIEEEKTLK